MVAGRGDRLGKYSYLRWSRSALFAWRGLCERLADDFRGEAHGDRLNRPAALNVKDVRRDAAKPLDMLLEIVCVSGNEARDLNGDRIRRVGILQSRPDGFLRKRAELRFGRCRVRNAMDIPSRSGTLLNVFARLSWDDSRVDGLDLGNPDLDVA